MTVARAFALAIFLMTYLGLALGRVPGFRIDRTGMAIVGAAAAVATGAITWDRAVAAVDAHTLTLIGSVANLIVVEAAREARIEIGFMDYARVGVPLTLATLVLGWALLC